MTHPGTRQLQRYALHELGAAQSLAVEEHLASCSDCARLAGAERRLDEWIVQTAPGPLPHGASRAAFDRLWAEVDAQPEQPASRTPATRPWFGVQLPRAAAAAALVLLTILLWQAIGGLDRSLPGENELAQTEPDSPASELDPARVSVAGEELDLARLALVRAEVEETLLSLDALAPADDAIFLSTARQAFEPLEADGWSVAHLVRGYVMGGETPVRAAALRYAALDPASTTTLATALDRPDLTEAVLGLLDSRRVSLALAPRLVRALSQLVAEHPDRPLSATGLVSADVLARNGGGVELAELLASAVARAATRSPQDVAVARAYELLQRAELADRVEALLRLGEAPAHEVRARAEFLALADAEPRRVSEVMLAVATDQLRSGPSVRPPVVLDWALAARLHTLAEPLALTLGGGTAEPSLLTFLAELGDARCVTLLFEAWREQGVSTSARPLAAALGVILGRDASASEALGSAVADGALHDLVRLVEEYPARVAGPVLVVCLQRRPRVRGTDDLQAFLISSIARLGTEHDGRALLAWIETRPSTDIGGGQLPLAWAAAALLTQEASLSAWERAGHDPRVLSDVADSTGPWPAAAKRPSARLLRSLDRSLKRSPSRVPDERATNDISRKETR
jgi:hypothetical protein